MKAPGGEDGCQRFKFFGQNRRRYSCGKLFENFVQFGGEFLTSNLSHSNFITSLIAMTSLKMSILLKELRIVIGGHLG